MNPRKGADMSPAPSVRCSGCGFSWNSAAMADGLRLLGSCPKCSGQLEFLDEAAAEDRVFFAPAPAAAPRARSTAAFPAAFPAAFSAYLAPPAPGQGLWWWRQAVLSAAVGIWATRRMHHVSPPCHPSV